MIGRVFFPMPVSYYRSTLTTALKDNENRNTLSKRWWLLSMSCAPLPEGAGLVFKPSGAPDSLRTQVHILAALTQSFIPLQRINWIPGYLLSFRWALKTQRLSLVAGDVGVFPVLLSLPWVPEPGLVPDVTHSPLKKDVYLGLSFLSSCCFFASMTWPAAFTP